MTLQIGMLFLLWQPLKELTKTDYRWVAIAAILAFPLTVITLGIGALSILAAVSIIRADYALRKDRAIEAAFWLTLATVKPQMLLFPLVAFLIAFGIRLLVPFLVMMAALCAASFALIGSQPYLDYFRLLSLIQNSPGQLSALIHTTSTIRGLLFTLLGYERVGLVNPLSFILLISGLATVMFIWWRGVDYEVGLALTVLLGLYLGPHVNPVDDFLLILPALLLYYKTRWQVLGSFLLIVPFAFFMEWRLTNLRPFSVTLHVLVIVLLAASVMTLIGKSHERQPLSNA